MAFKALLRLQREMALTIKVGFSQRKLHSNIDAFKSSSSYTFCMFADEDHSSRIGRVSCRTDPLDWTMVIQKQDKSLE